MKFEKKYIKQFITFVFVLLSLSINLSCSYDDSLLIVPTENDDNESIYIIHFIDVGQGDAIFVETPQLNMLVDGGYSDSGVTEYLEAIEVERIDVVIATHPHADHIGGLIDVFHTFDVGVVIDPGVTHTTVTFNSYLSAIDLYSIPFIVGRKGMTWQLSDEASMVLLHPVNPSANSLNNASIVARVLLGEIVLLLTGDAEEEAEKLMLYNPELLLSHILKVGHHGSHTSSTEEFLNAVKPEICIIMCGADNPYGHPHNVTLERLNAFGIDIYRTDIHGNIVIETNGIEYTVSTTL